MIGLLIFCFSSHFVLGEDVFAEDNDRCIVAHDRKLLTGIYEASKNTSELCFVRNEELVGTLDQFILVDTSKNLTDQYVRKDILSITASKIKTKKFLESKSLLVFSEPHKRHSLAKLCQELVNSGFEKPRILIGKRPKKLPELKSNLVSANDYLVEFSHFGVVTLATTPRVAMELANLGVPVVPHQEGVNLNTKVRNAFINYSLNGYLPIFVVAEDGQEQSIAKELKLGFKDEVFVVAGGLSALKNAVRNSVLGAAKRAGVDGMPGCAG
ncbi:hypothetical protein BTJ40_04675 [Microbulbifer sp. A4B17]|uniref:hypothetical protein n=1 Tax=Microbulbifer sp. A4B17 TaxID=359370 RepID=UPI000D52C0F7|nr:hypothetical protein [Microbulbifer sp. A4B17]AWF80168.1 hypothetical protein BTJ40_04675 [Microbulbifer sp. A4B17]